MSRPGGGFALEKMKVKFRDQKDIFRARKGWGVFLKVTERDGLWAKIKNHVGVKVKHPISPVTRNIRSRLSDEGVKRSVSVCPYCAVGCSTLVYHRDGRIIDIEGNLDSPINAGTLCPMGLANFGLYFSHFRWNIVKYLSLILM